MPRITTESYGAGNTAWLGSRHAINNARTEMVDVSAFDAADHYPNGYLPSGTAVAKVDGKLVPYETDEAVTTGAGVLAGHILFDQRVVGTEDFAAPLFDHGRVKADLVPGEFTAPTAAAKAATTIVYI